MFLKYRRKPNSHVPRIHHGTHGKCAEVVELCVRKVELGAFLYLRVVIESMARARLDVTVGVANLFLQR